LARTFGANCSKCQAASDRQIGSKAIQTFQDGPFGRVVEAGLNK